MVTSDIEFFFFEYLAVKDQSIIQTVILELNPEVSHEITRDWHLDLYSNLTVRSNYGVGRIFFSTNTSNLNIKGNITLRSIELDTARVFYMALRPVTLRGPGQISLQV